MIDLNSTRTLSDRINTIIDAVPFSEIPRTYLGCSVLGAECERAVQYEAIRAFYPESHKEISNDFPPRVRRIFKRGFLFEDEAIKWFQNAGFHLVTRDYRKLPQNAERHSNEVAGSNLKPRTDPRGLFVFARNEQIHKSRAERASEEFSTQNSNESECRKGLATECHSNETGEQLACEWFGGQLGGHLDGIFVFYHAPQPSLDNGNDGTSSSPFELPALWEHKCVNDKNFKLVIKDKLKKAFPKYYAQMQMYMNGYNLSQGIITFTNANTMELHHELIMYDDAEFIRLYNRAERVISATHRGEMLPRYGSVQNSAHFICKFCNYTKVCWA